MTGLVVVLCLFAYCGVGTVVGVKAAVQGMLRGENDPEFAACFVGVLWPIGLWFLLAMLLMDAELAKARRRQEEVQKREEAVRAQERLLEDTRRELEAL